MTGASAAVADGERLQRAAEWLVRVESDASARAEFDAWLAADPANLAAYRDVAGAWDALDELASSAELISYRRDALDNAARATRARRRGRTRRWAPMAAAAAAVTLLFGGAALWNAARVETHSFSTASGERKTVTLSDGSRVDLDQQTVLEVRYSRGARNLRLIRGQAEFDVAKNPNRPFSVTSGGRTVIATGTLFNVDLFDRELVVTLLDGRVVVTPEEAKAGRRSPDAVELRPAERLVVNGGAQTVLQVNISAEDAVAWKAGKLVFEDEPLADAVRRVNRYARTPVTIGDPATGNLRISGVFDIGDSAAFVSGVTAQLPVRSQAGRRGDVGLYPKL
jgi:transmembrane sensor